MPLLSLVLIVDDPAAPHVRARRVLQALLGSDVRVHVVAPHGVDVADAVAIRVAEAAGTGTRVLAGLAQATAPVVAWMRAGATDPVAVALGVERARDLGDGWWLTKGQGYGRTPRDAWATWRDGMAASLGAGRPLWDPDAHPVLAPRAWTRTWTAVPRDDTFDAWVLARARRDGLTVVRFPARASDRNRRQRAVTA